MYGSAALPAGRFYSPPALIGATPFHQNSGAPIFFCLLFPVSYVWRHARILRFKSPAGLFIRKKDW
jgi:hypothetical protein